MNAMNVAEAFPPSEYLRDELTARGWTQRDLATILGRPLQFVNALCNGRKLITAETAWGLGQAFGTGPEVWLNVQSIYLLWKSRPKTTAVERRAKAMAG